MVDLEKSEAPIVGSNQPNAEAQPQEELSIWELVRDRFALLVLTALGLFGAFFGIWDVWTLLKEAPKPEIDNRLSHITLQLSTILTILSALSLVVGLESFSQIRRLYKHFRSDEAFSNRLERQITTHFREDEAINEKININLQESRRFLLGQLGGRLLYPSKKQILDKLLDLACQAKNEIRLLVYGVKWLEDPEDQWSRKIANHIKHVKSHGVDFRYQIVACVQEQKLKEQQDFLEKISSRLKIYSDESVSEFLSLQSIDSKPVGLNVVIVDDNHSAITFSTQNIPDSDVNCCIIFEHNQNVANLLKSWFDNAIFPHSRPFQAFENIESGLARKLYPPNINLCGKWNYEVRNAADQITHKGECNIIRKENGDLAISGNRTWKQRPGSTELIRIQGGATWHSEGVHISQIGDSPRLSFVYAITDDRRIRAYCSLDLLHTLLESGNITEMRGDYAQLAPDTLFGHALFTRQLPNSSLNPDGPDRPAG